MGLPEPSVSFRYFLPAPALRAMITTYYVLEIGGDTQVEESLQTWLRDSAPAPMPKKAAKKVKARRQVAQQLNESRVPKDPAVLARPFSQSSGATWLLLVRPAKSYPKR